MSCDVLNLEWASAGRDREVASSICHTLRRRGYSVVEESVFNYKYWLLKHRPRLLYIADPTGARVNQDAALFAERVGVPSLCLDAEGDYADGLAEPMFWGHVGDRRLTQRLKLQWSARARGLVLAVAPELRDRLKVTGAVGFDRYVLEHFATKEAWREKYGFRHGRVVGFAGWTFDHLFGSVALREPWLDSFGEDTVERFRRDRDAVRELLTRLVEAHPDTLFVVKEHPGVVDSSETELAGLESLENVLLFSDQEPIADCINVCDVWMAFDSTTCIEAWLLGKPTLFVNPSGGDFPRTDVHRGTPILKSFEEVERALVEYEATGRIAAFQALEDARSRVLTDTLQWSDGKNHLRAAHYFEATLEGLPREPPDPFSLSERAAAYKQNVLFRGARYLPSLPGFRHNVAAHERFDRKQLKATERRIAAALDRLPPELSPEELAELEEVNS